jgi:hypothetical protein
LKLNQVKAALEVKLSGVLGMAISPTRRNFEIASTAGVKW